MSARRRNGLALGICTFFRQAGILHFARLAASRSLHDFALAEDMFSRRRNLPILRIGAPIVCTPEDALSCCTAGGSCHDGAFCEFMLLIFCLDGFRLFLAAAHARTGIDNGIRLRAERRAVGDTFVPIMPQRIHGLCLGISAAHARTTISCYSLFRTSRGNRCCSAIQLMSACSDRLCLGIRAALVGTTISTFARRRTGRLPCDRTLVQNMFAGCRDDLRLAEGATLIGAAVKSFTRRRAGGRLRHRALVECVHARRRDNFRFTVSATLVGTAVELFACRRAGGRLCHRSFIQRVPFMIRRQFLRTGSTTALARAGVSDRSAFRTQRPPGNFPRIPGMSERLALFHPTLTAIGTDIGYRSR